MAERKEVESTSVENDVPEKHVKADKSPSNSVKPTELNHHSKTNVPQIHIDKVDDQGNPVNKTHYDELTNKIACLNVSSNDVLPSVPTSPEENLPSAAAQTHRLKWIQWQGNPTAIVTQNENGPCPLIAIANILLLRRSIFLPISAQELRASDLLEFIGDILVDTIPKGIGSAAVLNYEQNMNDAIAVLPHLPTGLDVNVKFTGVRDFEYTPECIIFDLLNIPLYHGWLVDPQSYETVAVLGNYGYNEVVERIIANKSSANSNLVTEALVAEEFLERTATQLTYHGVCELNSTMKEGELAVLFRNNHFSTILKRKVSVCTEDAATQSMAKEVLNGLFLLVTDQGFLHEPRVVWETLCNIDGDGQFVDSTFQTVSPILAASSSKSVPEDQQIDNDYLVALSLQEDQKKLQHDKEQAWEEFKQIIPMAEDITDEELSRQLQDGDQRQTSSQPCEVATERPSSSSSSPNANDRTKKGLTNTSVNHLQQTF